jgi:putative membrane protein (TIGR04086 family)
MNADPSDSRMHGVRPTSIALGVIVDKLTAVLLIGTLMALLGVASRAFQVTALIVGFACTTLGAFVAGRHAKQRMVAHGLAVGLVGLAISVTRPLLTPEGSSATHSLPSELAAWSSVVVAGLAGGHLASRRSAAPAA